MSLENNIERIAVACESTATACINMLRIMQEQSGSAQAIQQVVEQTVATGAAAMQVTPQATVEQVQPTLQPVVTQPAPVTNCPITDTQALVQYVMATYQQLGAEKGAGIQTVLTNYGYANINDVKPEHYGAIWQDIETMKNA